MRYALAAILALGTLGGCEAVYGAFGVQKDGTVKPGGGPAGVVGDIVNLWIPGTTAVVGGVTTLLAALRGKKWKDAFVASAKVIEAGAEAGKSVVDLKKEMSVAHSAAGVKGIVEKVLDKHVR